ncbi:MAG: redox-regulated ATPase YchF [Thermoleophilia bacterium]|nr:redox-regulated ATPase YchF [Thermoleophilia bacterium]
MEARIIGLKGCGKTTLVAALAEGRGEGHIATVHVGDARVRTLSEIFQPKKTTFAEFKVQEVAWPEATGRKGEMERYLDALAGGQLYIHVLRAFDSVMLGEPAHPADDLDELDREFVLADLIRIERAFERAKKAPLPDSGKKALARCQEALEAETPLREVDFDETQLGFVRGYQFLTLTPQLIVVNTESESTWDPATFGSALRGRHVLAFPFTDALEVARLSLEEQEEYAAALGLPGPAAEVVAQAAFSQLGLISFLTSGSDEVRAWPIRAGETAREAAGAIHSDIQRGFIRAEVVSFTDFMSHGSNMKTCRDAGVLRVEGKDYIVADGDIVNFRFNV